MLFLGHSVQSIYSVLSGINMLKSQHFVCQ